eukprot:982306-Pyramimonas_sp.AAC.1
MPNWEWGMHASGPTGCFGGAPYRLFSFLALPDDPRGPQDRPKTALEASKRAPKRPTQEGPKTAQK